jgi:hypothetical protein
VDELTPEVDRDGHRGPIGPHAPADAIAGLDDHDALSGIDQISGGAQPGDPRTDDDDVEVMVTVPLSSCPIVFHVVSALPVLNGAHSLRTPRHWPTRRCVRHPPIGG